VLRYDTRCYFNVRSKADISQLNLPHGVSGLSSNTATYKPCRWTTLPRFHTIYFPDHCEQVIGLYCPIQGCLDPQEFACMPNRISTSTAATSRPTSATIFISLKTHTSIHTMHICTDIPKTEAGCQRGTNTYQCWPPLQLNDTIQVHKYTKSIKKKRNTDSIQVDKSPCAAHP